MSDLKACINLGRFYISIQLKSGIQILPFFQYFPLLFCSLVQILKVSLLGQIMSLPMGVYQYRDFTSFFQYFHLLFFSLVQILKVSLSGQIRSLPMGVPQYTTFINFLKNKINLPLQAFGPGGRLK